MFQIKRNIFFELPSFKHLTIIAFFLEIFIHTNHWNIISITFNSKILEYPIVFSRLYYQLWILLFPCAFDELNLFTVKWQCSAVLIAVTHFLFVKYTCFDPLRCASQLCEDFFTTILCTYSTANFSPHEHRWVNFRQKHVLKSLRF